MHNATEVRTTANLEPVVEIHGFKAFYALVNEMENRETKKRTEPNELKLYLT